MLKTIASCVASASRFDNNKFVGGRVVVGGDAVGWSDVLRKSAKSKSQIKNGHLSNSNNSKEPKFLTSEAKRTFNRLRHTFTKAPILRHFDSEYHIRIETNASG